VNAPRSTNQPALLPVRPATITVADEAHLHRALATVRWERKGLLQRLVRREAA
jgi:hypothetical protein